MIRQHIAVQKRSARTSKLCLKLTLRSILETTFLNQKNFKDVQGHSEGRGGKISSLHGSWSWSSDITHGRLPFKLPHVDSVILTQTFNPLTVTVLLWTVLTVTMGCCPDFLAFWYFCILYWSSHIFSCKQCIFSELHSSCLHSFL